MFWAIKTTVLSSYFILIPFVWRPGLEVIKLEFILKLKIKHNDSLLADIFRKQPIIEVYFELESELKFYNLQAWSRSLICGKSVTIKLSKARKITEITFEKLHLHNLLTRESQTVNKGEHLICSRHTILYKYSRTSMTHSPGLAGTIIMVPTGHFRHNPPWMGGTFLG